MKKNPIYLILLFLLSCKGSSENQFLLDTKVSNQTIDITVNKLKIPLDSLSLPYYPKSSSFSYKNNEFLAAYNPRVHSIDLFNLDDQTLVEHIYLEKQGPNVINRVHNISAHSPDSIFIFDSSKRFKLINRNAKVILKTPPTPSFEDLKKNEYGSLISINEGRFFYNSHSNSIIAHYKPFVGENEGLSTKKEIYNPIIVQMNLSTGLLKTLPIIYSPYALKHNDVFVSDLVPNISFHNDLITYNFSFESNIYTYNLNSGVQKSFGGASKNSKNLVDPYELNKVPIEQYIITDTRFLTTHYSSQNRVFMRLHWGDQPLKQANGKFNTLITKPAFLMIFNDTGDVLKELSLNRNEVFPDGAFSNSHGLHLWNDPTKITSDDTLKINQYVLKK